MRDLTQGSIAGHLLSMAGFIGISLIFQTMYFIVDLYFVSRLGSAAIAGVSAAGNVFFLALAASQLISIGVMATVAQAVGRRDEAEANLFSDQAISMSLLFGAVMLVAGYAFGGIGVDALTADTASAAAGRAYLFAFLPQLALMFPVAAMTSALRGAGVTMETMVLQTATIVLNAILAPVLIAGWGTGVPLGAAGAGWASSIAALIGTIALAFMFARVQKYLRLHLNSLKPKFDAWRRIIFIGLPTSIEFLMMFVIFIAIYFVIRNFGAEAQAGFGIGGRIMQSVFLPAMAVAFAAAPIAGQNFGAKRYDRVRETFNTTALISCGIMLTLSALCHISPGILARPFTDDPRVLAISNDYLQIVSWNFVFSGLVMSASSLFQGMGDTRPSLFASATRMITFVVPALWMSAQPWFTLYHVWLLSVASVVAQCALVIWLLFRTFKRKLTPLTEAPAH
ncbi:MATE family efflux transporter [Candidatus Viadribacter manganicus]|uniref:Multidrug-efflux transporter n=1 Tax=Candidatus Viadribacter manganicus TaxID=1759059 RepID=A0A1B1AI16_9PROT|nr:MATE family efflux transporter [Candidatus Viadribacter manganicus]ANP46202.1 MATE family efflux transporter [Candidatus Viadribacter manganicus]